MTPEEKIEQLEYKIGQAYQIIGTLLSGPDGRDPAFDTKAGQDILTYFSTDAYDDDILPFVHPMAKLISDQKSDGL